MADQPLVIGFETSCDETGVGLVRGRTLLADALATSMAEHERFGGVVPEIASRAHLEAMVPTVHRAQADARLVARGLEPENQRLAHPVRSLFITTASVPLGW